MIEARVKPRDVGLYHQSHFCLFLVLLHLPEPKQLCSLPPVYGHFHWKRLTSWQNKPSWHDPHLAPSPSCSLRFLLQTNPNMVGELRGGGPSIPSLDKYRDQQALKEISVQHYPERVPVPSFLFLTGVNGRKNTSIKNQSAGQELRIQHQQNQGSVSFFSLCSFRLLNSCHPFLQNPKEISHVWMMPVYTWLNMGIVNQLAFLQEASGFASSG